MENECSKCDGTFSTNDRQVQCSLCKDFFHVKCSVGTVKAFDLHKTKGFHWFCDDCDSENIAAELGELRKFKSNYDDIVSKFDNLQHKQSEYDERLDRIETKLVEIGSQKSVIHTTVNESLKDHIELEKRKMNLCVFNFESSDVNTDSTEFVKLCVEKLNINRDSLVNGVVKTRRIAPKMNSANNSTNPTRPNAMIVELNSSLLKTEILKNAPKLNFFGPNPKNRIYIQPDLTAKQQEEQKALVQELNRRRGLGENVMIRRGQVIRRVTSAPEAGQAGPSRPPLART